jgi:hypothetical protein
MFDVRQILWTIFHNSWGWEPGNLGILLIDLDQK